MSRTARALRLHSDTWYWLESESSWTGASLMVLGTYVMLAFDRFGWPGFPIRATTRLVLTGVYGWLWMAMASWLIVRVAYGGRGSISVLVRLVGHAHLPLLLTAIVIQIASVTFGLTGIALWPALFTAVFWMPAMVALAVSAWSELSLWHAAAVAAIPYAVWAAVVGRHTWRLLEHLL